MAVLNAGGKPPPVTCPCSVSCGLKKKKKLSKISLRLPRSEEHRLESPALALVFGSYIAFVTQRLGISVSSFVK